MNKMYQYVLYIKSHCEYPDWEQVVTASNKKEAVNRFYEMLHGDYDKSFIKLNLIRL